MFDFTIVKDASELPDSAAMPADVWLEDANDGVVWLNVRANGSERVVFELHPDGTGRLSKLVNGIGLQVNEDDENSILIVDG